VIVYSCGHPPAAVTSLNATVGIEQLSVAVALPWPGIPATEGNVLAVHSIVTSTGQVITGGVLSSTVIVCVQVDAF
jgi:hypothetical protein